MTEQPAQLVFTKHVLENSFNSCLTSSDNKLSTKKDLTSDIGFLLSIQEQCNFLCNILLARSELIKDGKKGCKKAENCERSSVHFKIETIDDSDLHICDQLLNFNRLAFQKSVNLIANSDLLFYSFEKRISCLENNIDYLFSLSGRTNFMLFPKQKALQSMLTTDTTSKASTSASKLSPEIVESTSKSSITITRVSSVKKEVQPSTSGFFTSKPSLKRNPTPSMYDLSAALDPSKRTEKYFDDSFEDDLTEDEALRLLEILSDPKPAITDAPFSKPVLREPRQETDNEDTKSSFEDDLIFGIKPEDSAKLEENGCSGENSTPAE